MDLNVRLAPQQRQSMNALMHRAVKFLQLPSLDFKMEMERLATINPFLAVSSNEYKADATDAGSVRGESISHADIPAHSPTCDHHGSAPADDPPGDTLVSHHSGEPASDLSFSQTRPTAPSWDQSLPDSGVTDIREYLLDQVRDLGLPERERALVLVIVHSLDDDGYLRDDADTLVSRLAGSLTASPGEVEAAVRRVQSLDPCGVGARSLSEYLSLQLLRRHPDSPTRATALRICQDHLLALGMHEYGRLSRVLGASRAEVLASIELILRLRPRIDVDHRVPPDALVVPDVTASVTRGGLALDLNRSVIPQLRLNDDYITCVQRGGFKRSDRINVCIAEARWAVRLIDQRLRTILDVSAAIARRQRHFFLVGDLALKPMTLREIALDIGVHESTVCRVTNGKYMSTPFGVVELKRFFSREVLTDSGRASSSNAVRGLVRSMLESAERPISDAEIAIQLATQGIRVSRRTVTKYRNALGLSPLALQKVQHRRA